MKHTVLSLVTLVAIVGLVTLQPPTHSGALAAGAGKITLTTVDVNSRSAQGLNARVEGPANENLVWGKRKTLGDQ